MSISLIPNPNFREYHEIIIPVSPEKAWNALKSVSIYDSKFILTMFKLRRMPISKPYQIIHSDWSNSWNKFFSYGFQPISIVKNKSITMLLEPDSRKYGKQIRIVWDFQIAKIPSGCRVSTETRVFLKIERFRKLFIPYWFIIRLPSGAIRIELLKLIKKEAIHVNKLAINIHST